MNTFSLLSTLHKSILQNLSVWKILSLFLKMKPAPIIEEILCVCDLPPFLKSKNSKHFTKESTSSQISNRLSQISNQEINNYLTSIAIQSHSMIFSNRQPIIDIHRTRDKKNLNHSSISVISVSVKKNTYLNSIINLCIQSKEKDNIFIYCNEHTRFAPMNKPIYSLSPFIQPI